MKIDLSKRQYKNLVKALFLASWVVNSHKTEEPDDEFEHLEQYILSHGKFFDLKNVDFDEKHGKYYHNMDFEQKTLKHLDDFVEESFWDELIDRLVDRDFFRVYGETKMRKMSRDQRFTKWHELAAPYEEEFSERGLENIVIRPSKQDDDATPP